MKSAKIKKIQEKFRLLGHFIKNPAGQQRHLLLRLILGCTTLITCSTTYFCYNYVRALLLKQLKENVLLEVQLEVSHIQRCLTMRKSEIEAIASSTMLETMDWSKIEPYFKSELNYWESFDYLAIFNLDRTSYVSQWEKVNCNFKNILPIQSSNTLKFFSNNLILPWLELPVYFFIKPFFSDLF